MKKLIVLLVLFICQFAVAQIQEPEFYDRDWFISFVQLDSQLYTLPEGIEPEESLMVFSENSPHFIATICSTVTGDIDPVISDNLFGFQNTIVVDQQPCGEPLNTDFDALHFNFYLDHANEVLEYDYYIIEPFGTYFMQIIAPNGDMVEYFSKGTMGIGQFATNSISVYPNPVSSIFQIKSYSSDTFAYEVFDLTGHLIKRGNTAFANTVSMEGITAGVYLLKLINKHNLSHTLKIVKK